MSWEQIVFLIVAIVWLAYRACRWLINRAVSRRIKAYAALRVQLEQRLVAYRQLRDGAPIEQQPGDPYSDDRIDAELIFIPTQRSKEDPR